ncbi:tRNA (adenosine(37)-N6)-threonylcarbamoyltransferase complex ATPase subunit type 1 TsaE [bacterium]|nr:tRNA (adenosine(37)-N6)-threonylcarbamoyltransferase complex ATPase subunit type 1 TsaE [bacterium]
MDCTEEQGKVCDSFVQSELPAVVKRVLPVFLQTRPLAPRESVSPGPVLVGLSGELGSGKTTFIRELVHQLGSRDPVSSPTYTLQHIYSTDLTRGEIHHWDLYRLGAAPPELFEAREEPEVAFILIEWPERDPVLKGYLDITVHLTGAGDSPRTLSITDLRHQ